MKRIFVGVTALVACAYACDSSPQSHVYVAALYNPTSACFGPSVSLGYIDTSDGNFDCAPTCIVNDSPPGGGSHLVYVSTMCGPYPNYDLSQTDPACAAALAAWPAEEAALANGTSSCASPVSEDAGEDAGSDGSAPADASEAG
jgi:hypothetical protein